MTWASEKIIIQSGEPPTVIASSINNRLAALGAVSLLSVDFYRDNAIAGQGSHILLSYDDPGPVGAYQAVSFVSTSATTAAALANAFFVANPTYRAHFILDVTKEQRRFIRRNAIVIVYQTDFSTPCGVGLSYPRIVRADGAINAAATGTANLMTTGGEDTTEQIQVVNSFDFTWPDNEEGWAIRDPATCDWIGYPTCCSAPP